MAASRDSTARPLCVGKAVPQVLVTEAPFVDVSSLWVLQTCTVPLVAATRHTGLPGLESIKIK